MFKSLGFMIALVFFSLFMHVLGTASLPLIDRDEPRYAETSREMLENGNWIVPSYNQQKSFQKPPLINWCQAISFRLFGENDFNARLPSLIAAALTALLIFGFGSRLYDPATGCWAALIFTLSFHVLWMARAATTDMVLIFFVTLAHWAGWELLALREKHDSQDLSRTFWGWAFYLSLGCGFLTKGPVGWLPLGTLVLCAYARKENSLRVLSAKGILLMLALIAVWALPAMLLTRGDYLRVFLREHVFLRAIVPQQGHGDSGLVSYFWNLPYYLVALCLSFFPWSLFLPQVFFYFRKSEKRGLRQTYLLSGILLIFSAFTLARTKLPHYTLSAFPLLSLLFAGYWHAVKKARRRLIFGAVTGILLNLGLAFILFPAVTRFLPVPLLAQQSAPWLKPGMAFASAGYQEPSLVWYFRKHLRGWHRFLKPGEVTAYMDQSGPRLLFLPAPLAASAFPEINPGWKVFRAGGINPAKMENADFTVLIKPD